MDSRLANGKRQPYILRGLCQLLLPIGIHPDTVCREEEAIRPTVANTEVYHFYVYRPSCSPTSVSNVYKNIFVKQRPQQSGFIPGRSTLDCIIALRPIAERRHAYRQRLYASYINLRATFDSLDCNSLCNILKTIDIPKHLLTASIRSIHPHTAVRVI